jgi:hypothetical protein
MAASPCGNHLATGWQVGAGVSPALDAMLKEARAAGAVNGSTQIACRCDSRDPADSLKMQHGEAPAYGRPKTRF